MQTLEKVVEWAKIYAMEEPQLHLLYEIDKAGFPNIGLPCQSKDDRFNGMYIYIPDEYAKNKLPKFVEETMDTLAKEGNFVIACDSFHTTKNFIMNFLKVEKPRGKMLDYPDPRLFPDEISLN